MRLSFQNPMSNALWLAATVSLLALLYPVATRRATKVDPLNPPAPELLGGPWLNTPGNRPLRLADQRGKVVVLHFWTFG